MGCVRGAKAYVFSVCGLYDLSISNGLQSGLSQNYFLRS